MEDAVYNKNNDTNISLVVNATLIDIYNGAKITVHKGQPWAYKFFIPQWPEGANTLIGRGEAELKIGMGYILHGHLSINEGKNWTRTAFEVDDAVELGSTARQEEKCPEFRVSGFVLEAKNGWITLGWERIDDDVGNFAWVYVRVQWEEANEDMLFKQYYVEGHMNGYDPMKDWVATLVTPAP
ncbi:uncharacterized protein EAF01_009137 [Botrytis porri]|uniref:Uncharacterized protein n=1 Tax=Botrytis porri TaxID=87229 RepID=A0A4Z1KIB1_9HELO|nr:uncharacterized protein EAF01_009137 [Botrytis porri]KAF7896734.1 hypothetical protein EAF01_009137 [Botrytis porri]TGO83962.1 hypothetical protein BPOR_0569g00080 [Botrytis porri]